MPVKKGVKGVIYLAASLLVLVLAGTMGYMAIEGLPPLDALFMTVITLSTVGFTLLKPMTDGGKLFTIVLIVVGVATFSFHLTRLFSYVVEAGFMEALERRRMTKKIEELKNHYVVCGHGRIGSVVVSELHERKVPLLVIENRPEDAAALQDLGILVLVGDAREQAVLRAAGLERAAGLVVLLPNDADNLYVILEARELNPSLCIMARANHPEGERRLRKAGATKVLSPHREGGKRIAHMILHPGVTDFIEMATSRSGLHLQLGEFVVREGSPLAGKTLTEAALPQKHKTLVVAVKGVDGAMTFNPEGSTRVKAGDALIVLGPTLDEALF